MISSSLFLTNSIIRLTKTQQNRKKCRKSDLFPAITMHTFSYAQMYILQSMHRPGMQHLFAKIDAPDPLAGMFSERRYAIRRCVCKKRTQAASAPCAPRPPPYPLGTISGATYLFSSTEQKLPPRKQNTEIAHKKTLLFGESS